MPDEFRVAGAKLRLDELNVGAFGVIRELLAPDGLLKHIHQVHRIGGDLLGVVIVGRRQRLEREARRDAVHAFVDAGMVAVFLHGAGLGIDLLQALAVVDPHLGVKARILMRLEARQHGEPRQHVERTRRARRLSQLGAADELLVDLLLFPDTQAVRNLDHIDAVDEGFVGLVVLEGPPFGLVRVRQDDAVERDRADILGPDIVAFLRRRQKRVQHLDRRLEHLDEFEHALVGAVQAARIGVGVWVILREQLKPADVHLADQRGHVLVVFVARLGFGNRDLAQARWRELGHAELGDVAAELIKPLQAPRAHHPGQAALRNAIFLLDPVAHDFGIEQAERAFEDRAKVVARLQHVDGIDFHERLDALGERGFAAADRPEQIQDLLALLQALRALPEEGDDPLDRFLHAVELGEGGIHPDRAVHEYAAAAGILRGVHHLRLADGGQQPLVRRGIHERVRLAPVQELGNRHQRFAPCFEASRICVKQVSRHRDPADRR